MTAKQALREHIESLTEEEAAELLDRLEWEMTEEETLTPDQKRLLAEGKEQFDAGEYVDGDAFLRARGM